MATTHRATVYLQLEAKFARRWSNHEQVDIVESIRAVAMTQKRPERPRGGTVTVKLTVDVPDAAFLPLRPEAIVVVPTDMTVANPIEVEASSPEEE